MDVVANASSNSGDNGTSSATPVVTGAVLALQGMVRAEHGFDLDARLARDIVENPMLNGETIRLDGAIRMAAK